MCRITSFSCSSRPAFFTVIKSFLESKCTVICFDLAAHQILRSPIAVSLQIRVSSCVTAFHSAHFSKIASLTLFQTRGARATANATLCVSSYICSSSVSFAARYSCAACLVLSSLIWPVSQYMILHDIKLVCLKMELTLVRSRDTLRRSGHSLLCPQRNLLSRPLFNKGNEIEQDSRPGDFCIVLLFSPASCACAMYRPAVPESAEHTRCSCHRL